MTKISPQKFPVKYLFVKMLLFSEQYRTFFCLHSTPSYHLCCVWGEILHWIFPLRQIWEFLATKLVEVGYGSKMHGHAKHLQVKKLLLCQGSECFSCPVLQGPRELSDIHMRSPGWTGAPCAPLHWRIVWHSVVSITSSPGVEPAGVLGKHRNGVRGEAAILLYFKLVGKAGNQPWKHKRGASIHNPRTELQCLQEREKSGESCP